jgi:hypothetical protein
VIRVTVTPLTARHSPLTSTAHSVTTNGVGTMIDNNHELTIGELDAVNGGFLREIIARIVENRRNERNAQDDKNQADALKGFQQILQEI